MKNLAALAAGLLVAVACGGGAPTTSPAPSASTTASAAATAIETVDARLARLYDAAKAEGTVAAYWSLNTQFANPLIDAFQKRFPGIKVEHTRASSATLVQRTLTERKAGQSFADFFEMEAFDMKVIIDAGYTQRYRPAAVEDIPAAARAANDAWIADRLNNDYPAINTNKLKPGEIKTWKDLCDKRLEGHVAIEKDQVAIYSSWKKIFGEAEAQALLKCIAANKVLPRSGNTEMANLLAAGDYWATVSLHAPAVTPLKYETKQSVDLVVTDPIITYLQVFAISDKPPHPNAAKLFVEWLVSPDGQQKLADLGQSPASTKTTPKYPELASTGKHFYITPDLAADFERDAEFWRTTLGLK